MGAPKQRWTSEEEAALRTGVAKHGVGNWRTILNDPELSSILRYRSNVDLKVKTVDLIPLKLSLLKELPIFCIPVKFPELIFTLNYYPFFILITITT